MSFEIFYSVKALKELKKIDKSLKIQLIKKIEELKQTLELGKPLSNVFKNFRSLHIEKFRVIYSIKTNSNEVIIATVKHRKNVYETEF